MDKLKQESSCRDHVSTLLAILGCDPGILQWTFEGPVCTGAIAIDQPFVVGPLPSKLGSLDWAPNSKNGTIKSKPGPGFFPKSPSCFCLDIMKYLKIKNANICVLDYLFVPTSRQVR